MAAGEQLATRTQRPPERCPECGRPAVAVSSCTACGFELAPNLAISQRAPLALTGTRMPLSISSPATSAARLSEPSTTRSRAGTPDFFRRQSLSGRVLMVMPPAFEPMDPDPWKWLAVPLWGIILFVSPFIAGLMALQVAGWLVAAVVFFLLVSLLRFLFSSHLIWSWQTVAALRGRHVVEPMPVIMLRVRLGNDREVQLRMKGHSEGGAVATGDRVEATGTWRNGVLRVSELRCRRTGAVLRPRQPRALPWLLAATGILLLAGLWLHVSFLPWMHSTTSLMR